MISGVHASTTTVALQSLRSLSYDDEGVAIEAAMGPLFDAIEQREGLGDAVSALDTVVVPGLRRVLRRPSKGEKRLSRACVCGVVQCVVRQAHRR